MSHRNTVMTAVVATLLLAGTASAASIMDLNLDTHGGFEVGLVTTPENGGFINAGDASVASPAFDFTAGAGIAADGTAGPPAAASLYLDSAGAEDQVPFEGDNVGFMHVAGGPAQAHVFGGTFETTPGEEYTIEWYISRAPNRFSAQSQLRLYDAPSGGGLSAYLFSGLFTQDDTVAPTWEFKTLTFTAPSDGIHIQFYAQNREGATPDSVTLFDGVRVIPEPASLALCGFASLLLRRR